MHWKHKFKIFPQTLLSSEKLDITCCKFFSKHHHQVYSVSYNKREMRMPFNGINETVINPI